MRRQLHKYVMRVVTWDNSAIYDLIFRCELCAKESR